MQIGWRFGSEYLAVACVVSASLCMMPLCVSAGGQLHTLVGEGANVRFRVPTDATEDAIWKARGFDDSAWMAGQLGLGFDNGFTYPPFIRTDLSSAMRGVSATVYIRIPFNVPVGELISLVLSVRYDDGFVAYLNGSEIARDVAPLLPRFDSRANGNNPDPQAVMLREFDVTDRISFLARGGENILAVHGLNSSVSSSDALFDVRLVSRTTSTGPTSPTSISSIERISDRIRLTSFSDPCLQIGVEYSPDLSPASWIELGNFFPDGAKLTFIDPDPIRTARPKGYYRAFLRPSPP